MIEPNDGASMAEKYPRGQDQRVTFRVAVRPSAGIDAHVLFAGRKLQATVGDLSAEGLFVTLARGAIAALQPDSMVDVEITFEGETLVLFGVVRSARAGGYGLHFPARDPAGRVNPLNRFGRICTQLQRSSLSQRLKILKLPE